MKCATVLSLCVGMALAAAVTACGADDSISARGAGQGSALGEITTLDAGTWEGACTGSRIDGFRVKGYIRFESAGRFARLEEYSKDGRCKAPLFAIRYSGEYVLREPSLHIPGARQIDEYFSHAFITPLNEAGAELLNEKRSCGLEEWRDGVEVDVTRFSLVNECESQVIPDFRYDIYMIRGSRLYFGLETEDRHRLVPGRRPKEIEFDAPYQQSDRVFEVGVD